MNNDVRIGRLYLEIDGRCNLNCIHCSDFNKQNKIQKLNKEELFKFYQMISNNNDTEVVITGGEPSLHPDFYHIVEYFASLTKVTITTNGTIIDNSKIIALMKKNKNIILQISMDGITKETFEYIRGIDSFKKVHELLNLINEEELNSQVGISMVILAANYLEIDEMIKFCINRKFKYLYFPTALPSGNLKRTWSELMLNTNEQEKIYNRLFEQINSNNSELPIYSNYLNQICSMLMGESDCFANFSLKVNPEGYIFPCPAATNKKYIIGRYDTITFPKLYLQLKQLRENTSLSATHILDEKKNGKKFCANCKLFCENPDEKCIRYYSSLNSHFIDSALKELEEE